MTERHLIAYAILLLVLIGAALLWRRRRSVQRPSDSHLRIDLLSDEPGDPDRVGP